MCCSFQHAMYNCLPLHRVSLVLLPQAIVDPQLVINMPKSLTAFGGIDALVHALESYVSIMATDYTRVGALCSTSSPAMLALLSPIVIDYMLVGVGEGCCGGQGVPVTGLHGRKKWLAGGWLHFRVKPPRPLISSSGPVARGCLHPFQVPAARIQVWGLGCHEAEGCRASKGAVGCLLATSNCTHLQTPYCTALFLCPATATALGTWRLASACILQPPLRAWRSQTHSSASATRCVGERPNASPNPNSSLCRGLTP